MKNIAILLSILMMTMSFTPCSDGHSEDHEEGIALEINHNHSQDSDDSCPVTCACTCCGTAITFEEIKLFELKISTKVVEKTKIEYSSIYYFNYLSEFWHPPQKIS
ncbi:DUF6660 family protein [Bacteroidota bacterium]